MCSPESGNSGGNKKRKFEKKRTAGKPNFSKLVLFRNKYELKIMVTRGMFVR